MCKLIALPPAIRSWWCCIPFPVAILLLFIPFSHASASLAGHCVADNVASNACSGTSDPGIAPLPAKSYRHVGNPVDIVTGAKQQHELDYQALGSPLHFSRYYHTSQTDSNLSLGYGWRHSYLVRLFSVDSHQWRVQQADGRWIHFAREPASDGVSRFKASLESDGYLVAGKKVSWYLPDGRVLHFQGSYLIAIAYPDGANLKLYYENRKLQSVTDERGQVLTFEYTVGRKGLPDYDQSRSGQLSGHLQALSLPSGQRIQFQYDVSGRLVQVVYPERAKRHYEYADQNFHAHLTSIENKPSSHHATTVGNESRHWLYDNAGRVIQFEHPGRQIRLTFQYEHTAQKKSVAGSDDLETGVTLVRYDHGRVEFYRWQRMRDSGEVTIRDVTAKVCADCELFSIHPRWPAANDGRSPLRTDQSNTDRQANVGIENSAQEDHVDVGLFPEFGQLVPSPFSLDQKADITIGGESFSFDIQVSRLGEVHDISVGSTSLSDLKDKWGQGRIEPCASEPLLRRSRIYPAPETGCMEDLIYLVELSRHLERISRHHGIKKRQPAPRSNTARSAIAPCLVNPFVSCESLQRDYEFAQMASCAYHKLPARCGDKWQAIKPSAVSIDKVLFSHDEFSATLFYNQQDDSYVVAYRGTDNIGDWKDNLIQAGGEVTSQYRRAVALARAVKRAFPNASISFTGHSLGGGLATAAALSVDAPAIVFNPAALHPATAMAMGLDYNKAQTLVQVTTVDGDLLTEVQGPSQANKTLPKNGPDAAENTRFAAPGKHTMIAAPDRQWIDKEKKHYPLLGRFDSLVLHSMHAVLRSEDNLLVDLCGKTPSSA